MATAPAFEALAQVESAPSAARILASQIKSIAVISTDTFCFTNYRSEFIASLVAEGVRVYAIGRHDDAGKDAIRALGAFPVNVDIDSTGMNPVADVRYLKRLTKILRELRPDATFSFFTKPLMYGSLAARIARVPRRFAMVSGLGYAFTQEGLKQRVARVILSLVCAAGLKACERVIFENDDDRAIFLSRGMLAADQVARVPGSGVNTQHFAPAPLPSAPLFLLIGRPLAEKGVREFVAAARAVHVQHPEARFVLLGGRTSNPGCLSEAELCDISPVEWVDQVADVRPWIAASSVVVLPSYREGLPRSVLEAMSMGRPIIATDVPGCREAVVNGETGLMVPPRDAGSLADAMAQMIDQPLAARRMAVAGLNRVRAMFDVHAVNDAIFAEMGHGIIRGAISTVSER